MQFYFQRSFSPIRTDAPYPISTNPSYYSRLQIHDFSSPEYHISFRLFFIWNLQCSFVYPDPILAAQVACTRSICFQALGSCLQISGLGLLFGFRNQ